MDNVLLNYVLYGLGGVTSTGILFFVLSVITVLNRRAEEALQQGDES